jgi:translation initiation factor IF-3
VVTYSRLRSNNYNKYNKRPHHIVNERIRADKLRVISEDENLGVISRDEALKHAREQGLDLVLIAPQSDPPVAKIMDFSKFLYEEKKKKSGSKGKKSELKEFKIRPSIGKSDLETRVERTKEFVKDGNRVKITVVLRGRENAHPEIARELLASITKQLEEVARPEGEPKHAGRMISIFYVRK